MIYLTLSIEYNHSHVSFHHCYYYFVLLFNRSVYLCLVLNANLYWAKEFFTRYFSTRFYFGNFDHFPIFKRPLYIL